MAFLSDLATNASANGVAMIFYSGNDDSLIAHRGTEGICLILYDVQVTQRVSGLSGHTGTIHYSCGSTNI